MAGAAKVNMNVINQTLSVSTPVNGVAFLQGRSVRGPFASPDEVINSWNRFVAIYGGLSTTTVAPQMIQRFLDKGGTVRFSRVGHYTDISDPSTLDAVKATQPEVTLITFESALVEDNVVTIKMTGGTELVINFTLDSETTLENVTNSLKTLPEVGSVELVGSIIFVTPAPNQNFDLDTVTVTGGDSQTLVFEDLADSIVDSNGLELFKLVPKYPGEDYNNFQVSVKPGSNGSANYFDIEIKHLTDPTIVETYTNLTIPIVNGYNPTIENSNYLNNITSRSNYFEVEYKDLSALVGSLNPLPISYRMTGGSDGSAPTDMDYIGDSSSRNGFYAFDEYDDTYYLGTLDNESDTVMIAGSAYANKRKDLIYFIEAPLDLKSKNSILQFKQNLNIDNEFAYIFGGGLQLINPFNSQKQANKGIGDVLALAVDSDSNFGPWYSFAGPNRGNIQGAIDVVNNFGAPANYKDLDELANRRINMVINRSSSIKLWGNFSAHLAEDQLRFLNIVKLIIFLKKSLRPTLETFLEEPNDIPTWARIYYTIKPFMDSLVTKRAIYTYDWQGDQFANSMEDLKINNAADVSDGKYKILMPIQAIPSLQEINLGIILTKAGVDFETTLQQL